MTSFYETKMRGRLSYHAVYDDSILDALRWAGRNGFNGVQAAVESPHLHFDRLRPTEIREIRKTLERTGLYLTLHGPDTIASLYERTPALRQGIFRYYASLFDFAEKAGACLITIHLGQPSTYPTASLPECSMPVRDASLYRRTLRENIGRLIRLCPRRLILCVENYHLDALALGVLDKFVRRGQLHLCWDLPKTTPASERFYRRNLKQVRQLHLHDVQTMPDGRIRSHRVIGDGNIDFQRYLNMLRTVDIKDFCLEVRPREIAKGALDKLKQW